MVYSLETAQASARAGFRHNAEPLHCNKRIWSRVRLCNLQLGGRLPSPCNLQPPASTFNLQQHTKFLRWHFPALLFLWLATSSAFASAGSQRAYEEWHRLTSSNAPPPKVLAKDDQVRIYFTTEEKEIVFSAKL